jgi:hypothetical protein
MMNEIVVCILIQNGFILRGIKISEKSVLLAPLVAKKQLCLPYFYFFLNIFPILDTDYHDRQKSKRQKTKTRPTF